MSWKSILLTVTLLMAGAGAAGSYETATVDLGRGLLNLYVPDGYSPDRPVALVLLLHGYTSNGSLHEIYFQLLPLVDEYSFLYLHPDGTIDRGGARFWNATDACCNFYDSDVDDSSYLLSIIAEVKRLYSVDPSRVFLIGHSNGGFMGYRMACDHAGEVTGAVSLAGATFLDPDDCQPRQPVHILQIHGTNDETISYTGGCLTTFRCYPGASATVEQWAAFNGCSPEPESGDPIDLEVTIAGAETTVSAYPGCEAGGSAELWTIVDGWHSPVLQPDYARMVIAHLYEQTSLPTRRPSRRLHITSPALPSR